MAQRLKIEGFESDRVVAGLQVFATVLRKWNPALSEADATALLVRPPFELGRVLRDDEAEAAAKELRELGARITLEPAADDPTWWAERHGDTRFGATIDNAHADLSALPAAAKSTVVQAERLTGWPLWNEIVSHPSRFFASDLIREGGGNPIGFAIAVSVIGAILSVPGTYVLGEALGTTSGSFAMQIVKAVLLTPALTLMYLVFWAVILHIAAKLVGGVGGFGVAFRIMAYASAVNVFQAIPVLGQLAVMVCYYLFAFAGLQGGYHLTPVRAAAAMLAVLLVVAVVTAFVALAVLFVLGLANLGDWMDLLRASATPGSI